MTQKELEKLYVQTEHGTFTPTYVYDDFIYDEEIEDYVCVNLVITKTAEEVYQEWLYDKDHPITPQPDKISILQGQVTALEEENMVLSEYVLGLEMKSLEQEEAVTMTNEYVLDLDMRLTNIETK